MIKRLMPGEMCPRFYGLLSYDFMRNTHVVMLMPFNVIFGFLFVILSNIRWCWIKCMQSPREAFDQGYRAGLASINRKNCEL